MYLLLSSNLLPVDYQFLSVSATLQFAEAANSRLKEMPSVEFTSCHKRAARKKQATGKLQSLASFHLWKPAGHLVTAA
jgi:hypothetical protein